jgi:hypothetical protein
VRRPLPLVLALGGLALAVAVRVEVYGEGDKAHQGGKEALVLRTQNFGSDWTTQ